MYTNTILLSNEFKPPITTLNQPIMNKSTPSSVSFLLQPFKFVLKQIKGIEPSYISLKFCSHIDIKLLPDSVKELHLTHCNISSKDLKHLKKLPKLIVLSLKGERKVKTLKYIPYATKQQLQNLTLINCSPNLMCKDESTYIQQFTSVTHFEVGVATTNGDYIKKIQSFPPNVEELILLNTIYDQEYLPQCLKSFSLLSYKVCIEYPDSFLSPIVREKMFSLYHLQQLPKKIERIKIRGTFEGLTQENIQNEKEKRKYLKEIIVV